ncbi:MAG: HAMP domain-containing protein [Syntrophaceae bacterium]|nr:HAMP domain-containing protein [Syntrophaceae bacterium]
MKIGITQRLFFTILAATGLAILILYGIMRWNIDRGFYQYLATQDQGRVEQMAESLGQAYAGHGSWDFLKDSRGVWMGLTLRTASGNGLALTQEQMRQWGKEGEEKGGSSGPLVILDAERRPVFGSPAGEGEISFRPVVHEGRTVGYVGLHAPQRFLHPVQARFLSRQRLALALAAAGILFAVVLVALPLANRLVRPVRAMAAATHDLASGNYATRVPVSSSDELGRLAGDFNAMALTLEMNEKARRQWLADISHELRTPLTVLQGEIEALLDGIRTVTPETIRSLHAETMRLNRLVNDLYQLSLSDLGTLSYHKEDLDPAAVLRDSVESFRSEFARKSIRLETDVPERTDGTVFADPERLSQLFANLLDNSLKYTDAGGTLAVRLSGVSGEATIEFEDSAPGVPEEALSRLFDRLYRVEGSRARESGGAGLGLAICKNIVEAHAGTITAQASPRGGILIRIVLPAAGKFS